MEVAGLKETDGRLSTSSGVGRAVFRGSKVWGFSVLGGHMICGSLHL